MAFDFAGKAIVVTGGAAGLGKAFCQEMAKRGALVGVADIEGGKAEAVTSEIGDSAFGFQVDVSDRASIEKLAEDAWHAFGRVDGIFNNAGIGAGRDILRTSEDDLDWVLSVNLKGVWHGCQVFGQRFRDQGGPALIVNTGSEHSLGVPHLRGGAYTASKHAVHGLTDVLRREVPEDIQVSLFCPGIVATEIWNSGRNRPEGIGGPSEAHPVAEAIQSRGMAASDVAARALDAIETGAFYIVSHPHNMDMVEARHSELSAAFEAQTADVDGNGYDVNDVVANVMAELAPKTP